MIKQAGQSIEAAGAPRFAEALDPGLDDCRQQHRIERLDQKLVAAETQRFNLHADLGFARQIDNRQRTVGRHLAQHARRFDAIETRHVHVHQDQVGTVGLKHIEQLARVVDRLSVDAVLRQRALDQRHRHSRIFDDEYAILLLLIGLHQIEYAVKH